jgi:hypothetical protein
MGQIYSQATQVIAWLGTSPRVLTFLEHFLNDRRFFEDDILHNNLVYQDIPVESRMNFLDVEYWRRAWIIQELVLARHVVLPTPSTDLNYERIPKFLGRLGSRLPDQDLRGKALVELLSIFRGRGCAAKRDRIFSLSALCSEDLHIDYGITDEEVLLQTLQACHATLCFCTVSVVVQALGLDDSNVPLAPLVDLELFPVPAQTTCCDYGGHHLPSGWVINGKKSLLFCLSSTCRDLAMHLYCEETLTSGLYHAYLAGWRIGDKASQVATTDMGCAVPPFTHNDNLLDPIRRPHPIGIIRKSEEEPFCLRLSLRTVVILAMASQHCWDHILPHEATLRILGHGTAH